VIDYEIPYSKNLGSFKIYFALTDNISKFIVVVIVSDRQKDTQ